MTTNEALLIKVDEVAARIAVSRATVYRLVMSGKFPQPIKLGRSSVWRSSDVEAWASSLRPESAH